jgi:hypothetical protein
MAEAEQDESDEFKGIKDRIMKIAGAKDLDFLLAELKGNKSDALIVALQDEDSKTSI